VNNFRSEVVGKYRRRIKSQFEKENRNLRKYLNSNFIHKGTPLEAAGTLGVNTEEVLRDHREYFMLLDKPFDQNSCIWIGW
jgi:hypothetical protein